MICPVAVYIAAGENGGTRSGPVAVSRRRFAATLHLPIPHAAVRDKSRAAAALVGNGCFFLISASLWEFPAPARAGRTMRPFFRP